MTNTSRRIPQWKFNVIDYIVIVYLSVWVCIKRKIVLYQVPHSAPLHSLLLSDSYSFPLWSTPVTGAPVMTEHKQHSPAAPTLGENHLQCSLIQPQIIIRCWYHLYKWNINKHEVVAVSHFWSNNKISFKFMMP